MPLPISLPYTFANATTAIPLSQLDTDLTTLRDGINGIGNGTNALANVTITGGTITNVTVASSNISTLSNGTSNVAIATANGNVTIATAGNERIRVDTSGNVGIGTSNTIGQKFISVGTSGTPQAVFATSANSWSVNIFDSSTAYMTAGGLNITSVGLGASANIPMFFVTNNIERMRIDSSGNVGIGTTSPTQALTVSGAVGFNAPVTITAATYSVGTTDNFIIANRAGTITLTLPTASSYTGRILFIKTVQAQAVVSAASNVVPVTGTTAGTSILPATDGANVMLVSDGTNWITMLSS